MADHRMNSFAASISAFWIICFLSHPELQAQSRRSYSGDGPNKVTYTDVAVGQMVDSLFAADLPRMASAAKTRKAQQQPVRRAVPRLSVTSGKLVNNPETSDGSPEYALVDRYGGVLRYVEPVDQIDLERYVGETVKVRHDTGDILLASQLDLGSGPTTEGEVQLAAFQEELVDPGPTDAEEVIMPEPDPMYYFDEGEGLHFGGCPDCGSYTCVQRHGCSPGARGIVYLQAEYLLWWAQGMEIPPLVVEGDDDGDGNFVNAVIVYGNEEILDDRRDGYRFRGGLWLDDCGQWAIEGEYFGFDRLRSRFEDGGDGETPPFVGRPFIDATTGFDAVQDVSFPGIQGDVFVNATSEFESAALRIRHNLCCVPGSCGGCGGCGDPVGCGYGVGCGSGVCRGGKGTRRVDFLFGLRYYRLDEGLVITEDLETIEDPPPNTEIFGQDRFFTDNEFYGGELGFLWEWECRRWSLELISVVAIGNNEQTVRISGFTERDTNLGNGIETKEGLLLTQTTNIGRYRRDEFTMIPQVGATVGFQLTPRLRLRGGYTLVYWGNVVRPGEQIDLEVNPALLTFPPDPDPIPARPRFAFDETDFWAHGINLGGELHW